MTIAMAGKIRSSRGKGAAKKMRAAGACPAVLYGRGTAAVSLEVDPKGFLKILSTAGENALIDLGLVDEQGRAVETKKVIVREIQYDPLKPLPTHIDFYQVSLDRAIEVRVALELVGVPAGVATKSATLNQTVHELHVECLPDRIPARLTLDVAALEIGHALHVRDLAVPEGVTVLDAPELTVVSLAPIHAEAEAAAAPQLETAEPEVIRERKGAEEAE